MAIGIVSPLVALDQELVLGDGISGSQEDIQTKYGVFMLVADRGQASMPLGRESQCVPKVGYIQAIGGKGGDKRRQKRQQRHNSHDGFDAVGKYGERWQVCFRSETAVGSRPLNHIVMARAHLPSCKGANLPSFVYDASTSLHIFSLCLSL